MNHRRQTFPLPKEKLTLSQNSHFLRVIGVGSDADTEELEAIASSPAEQNVFTVDNYSALQHIKDLLAIEACSGECGFQHLQVKRRREHC